VAILQLRWRFVTEDNNGDMSPPPVTMSDSAGITYAMFNEVTDAPDFGAVLGFAVSNVAATGNPLKVTLAFDRVNQWQGIVVMEIAGAGPLPVIGASSDVVFEDCCGSHGDLPDTLPSISLSAPAPVVAFSYGFDPSSAGSGYTVLGSACNWQGLEGSCDCNSATLEYGTFHVASAIPSFVPNSWVSNFSNMAVAIRSN